MSAQYLAVDEPALHVPQEAAEAAAETLSDASTQWRTHRARIVTQRPSESIHRNTREAASYSAHILHNATMYSTVLQCVTLHIKQGQKGNSILKIGCATGGNKPAAAPSCTSAKTTVCSKVTFSSSTHPSQGLLNHKIRGPCSNHSTETSPAGRSHCAACQWAVQHSPSLTTCSPTLSARDMGAQRRITAPTLPNPIL